MDFEQKMKKQGGSLMVVVPPEICNVLGLKKGTKIIETIENNILTLRKATA